MGTNIKMVDTATLFRSDEDQVHLIRDALASGDAHYIAHAIGVVARARGLSDMERETGIKRQTLHKALSSDGNPTLETILPVLKALNLQLDVHQAKAA
ncbi:MAG TPA: addiction module antidote protein [Sphingomicrobium sp.]